MTYVEPFVGGGAVLFWILQEYPNITRAIINDINEELICTYRVIKSDVENLILELDRIQNEYLALDDAGRKEYYLSQRECYNEGKHLDVETAALFIFLNRTCFNGLYRVNSKGKFNVPHGRYTNPKICDAETLRADSAVLGRVEILCGDFAQTGKFAGDNVLYYFDPPYRPLTETSAFTSYAKDGFDDEEQMRLRDFCRTLIAQKAMVFDCRSIHQQPFMFYTSEGDSYSPSMEIVENFQILGFESGYNMDDALYKLLVANDWITDYMYSVEKIKGRRIVL